MVIVGLSDANLYDSISFSKPDYTIPYNDCQQLSWDYTTKKYNYLTTEDFIKIQIQKTQDKLPKH